MEQDIAQEGIRAGVMVSVVWIAMPLLGRWIVPLYWHPTLRPGHGYADCDPYMRLSVYRHPPPFGKALAKILLWIYVAAGGG